MVAVLMKNMLASGWMLVALCLPAWAGAMPLRVWTSDGGDTVEAAFMEERGHFVILRDQRGALFQIRTDQLAPVDQAHVASLRAPLRYIFFHVASTDPHLRWDQGNPASFTRAMFDDLLEKVEPATDRALQVGLSFSFSVLQTSLETQASSLDALLALSVETGIPVQINVDGQNWWGHRPDLWNWWDPGRPGYDPDNRHNVEWTDWDPDNAVKLCWRNWGRQIRVLPEQNLMSPAVLEATIAGIRPLASKVAKWADALPPGQKHLFGGFRVGWETSIGVNAYHYPEGNRYLDRDRADDPVQGRNHAVDQFGGLAPLGYAALTTAGIKTDGEITPADIAEVVRRYLAVLSKAASEEGIPRHLLFTHQGGTYHPFEKHLPFDPSINEWSTPGWSFYGLDPDRPPQLRQALEDAGQESWAAVEWWWGAPDQAGWRSNFARTLGWKDCRFVTVYNWQSFRNNRQALEAVRALVAEAPSIGETGAGGIPSP